MKKTIITLLFLILTFGLFSETGYNGTAWKKQRDKLNFGKHAEDWELGNFCIVSFGTVILGDDSIKSYFFDKEKGLNCVSYYIPEKSLKELLSKFDSNKKVYEIKTQLFSKDELTGEVNNLIKTNETPSFYDGTDDATTAFMIILGEISLYEIANITEIKGYKNIKEAKSGPGVGTLYIYDYNDDTRIYISSGNIEGLAFVAYVPHSQDY